MTDRQMRAFCLTAERKSFSAAAHELFISPQALTQQMNQFEQEIGAHLFRRTRRGLSLTPAGEIVYKDCVQIIKQIDALSKKAQKAEQKEKNRLHIGMFDASPMLQYFCDHYAEERPDVVQRFVHVSSADWMNAIRDIQDGILDVMEHADTPMIHDIPGISYRPLYSAGNSCLVLPGSPLEKKEFITVHDLEGYNVGIHDPSCVQDLTLLFRKDAPSASLVARPDAVQSAIEICAEGGVFLIPDLYNFLFVPLKAIPFRCNLKWTFGLLYKDPPSPLVRGFVEFSESIRNEMVSAIREKTLSDPERVVDLQRS